MTIIDDKFWEWVEHHMNDNPIKLRLKYAAAKDGFDYDEAITQIECRRRFGKKIAETLSSTPKFYFPNKLSGEQSTSDRLAEFHTSLIKGKTMIDLTAGLGIDVLHCSRICDSATAIERSQKLTDALVYNSAQAGCGNITVICGDCRDIIKGSDIIYDTVFIDPARRATDGGRVFSLNDCEPDVTAMLTELERMCKRLVVKMSPMLDISHTIGILKGCIRVITLGNTTECKELIAVKDFDEKDNEPAVIDAVTLVDGKIISFSYTNEEEHIAATPTYSLCASGEYFYEPYPSVMKTGASKLLANRYGLDAFHPNSRLYHSQNLVEDFPGTVFKIEKVIDFSSKFLKRFKNEYPKINIATRNFGMGAEELKKKLGVKDGGEKRLMGLCDNNNARKLIVLDKI
ncbi:MAG: class I SAM-dependent methyltransferase [Muribaculaceae bacterium]|nr:class I SAM-dependent methyltransferase [Muribaculaceae bacterium]